MDLKYVKDVVGSTSLLTKLTINIYRLKIFIIIV